MAEGYLRYQNSFQNWRSWRYLLSRALWNEVNLQSFYRSLIYHTTILKMCLRGLEFYQCLNKSGFVFINLLTFLSNYSPLLQLEGNINMKTPPMEIIYQGSANIITFLRANPSVPCFKTKLMLVSLLLFSIDCLSLTTSCRLDWEGLGKRLCCMHSKKGNSLWTVALMELTSVHGSWKTHVSSSVCGISQDKWCIFCWF